METVELIDLDTGETMEVPKDKVNHPAAGLQFSGEPTERALRARACLKEADENGDDGVLYTIIFRDPSYEDLLKPALQLMAEERR